MIMMASTHPSFHSCLSFWSDSFAQCIVLVYAFISCSSPNNFFNPKCAHLWDGKTWSTCFHLQPYSILLSNWVAQDVSLVSDLKESQGKSMQQKEQANLNLWRFPLWEHCPLLHHQGVRDLMIHPHPGLKWSQEHACYPIDHLMPVLYTSSNGELLGYLRRRTF